jgi:hypothetical protein
MSEDEDAPIMFRFVYPDGYISSRGGPNQKWWPRPAGTSKKDRDKSKREKEANKRIFAQGLVPKFNLCCWEKNKWVDLHYLPLCLMTNRVERGLPGCPLENLENQEERKGTDMNDIPAVTEDFLRKLEVKVSAIYKRNQHWKKMLLLQ